MRKRIISAVAVLACGVMMVTGSVIAYESQDHKDVLTAGVFDYTSVDNADEAVEIVERHFHEYEKIDVAKDVAKVSIVGAGMMSNAGVAAKMFEALYDEGINIRMISTSEIRVSVLIDEKYTERAMNAIHDKFNLED